MRASGLRQTSGAHVAFSRTTRTVRVGLLHGQRHWTVRRQIACCVVDTHLDALTRRSAEAELDAVPHGRDRTARLRGGAALDPSVGCLQLDPSHIARCAGGQVDEIMTTDVVTAAATDMCNSAYDQE